MKDLALIAIYKLATTVKLLQRGARPRGVSGQHTVERHRQVSRHRQCSLESLLPRLGPAADGRLGADSRRRA